jgi:hypothetical protein
VATFYIGVNPRFDEFVAPTLHFSCEPGKPDCHLSVHVRAVQRKEDSTGQSSWPDATAAAAPYVKKAECENSTPRTLCGRHECRWLGGDAPEDRGSGLLNGFQALA